MNISDFLNCVSSYTILPSGDLGDDSYSQHRVCIPALGEKDLCKEQTGINRLSVPSIAGQDAIAEADNLL